MKRKIVFRQVAFLLKQKEALLTSFLLLLLVLGNYLRNVLDFRGMDVSQMYHPMKLLTLSYNRTYYNADVTLLLTMLYPFLVALPAGVSYAKEQQTKEEIYVMARLGKKRYWACKLCAAFLTTFLVFSAPFLLEIIINYLTFPVKAQGDFSHLSIYSKEYERMVSAYAGSGLYRISPALYAVFETLLFGVYSGIFSMVTLAVSFIASVKYRVLLLLPTVVLLNMGAWFHVFNQRFAMSWTAYMLLFHDESKSLLYWNGCMLCLLVMIAALSLWGMKKERY